MTIRLARPDDALEISAVLCASIRDLCAADHLDDEARISAWISNKTPEHVRRWIGDERKRLFVATLDEVIVGVSCLSLSGEVLLNYVAPTNRFTGISQAMMNQMEAELAAAGIGEVRLTSTATALRFYLGQGYVENGPGGWDWGYPMIKHLAVKRP